VMCNEWRNSFLAFLRDMGDRPQDHSIDRIDVNGHYEPGNCRWASRYTQGGNRRTNRFIQFAGESLILRDWSDRLGVTPGRLSGMLVRDLSMPEIFEIVHMEQQEKSLTVNGERSTEPEHLFPGGPYLESPHWMSPDFVPGGSSVFSEAPKMFA
jgi:hypothetical protein